MANPQQGGHRSSHSNASQATLPLPRRAERLDAGVIGSDHNCPFGQGIRVIGRELHGEPEMFQRPDITHAEFHRCAGEIARSVDTGHKGGAVRLHNSTDYPKYSEQVKAESRGGVIVLTTVPPRSAPADT